MIWLITTSEELCLLLMLHLQTRCLYIKDFSLKGFSQLSCHSSDQPTPSLKTQVVTFIFCDIHSSIETRIVSAFAAGFISISSQTCRCCFHERYICRKKVILTDNICYKGQFWKGLFNQCLILLQFPTIVKILVMSV